MKLSPASRMVGLRRLAALAASTLLAWPSPRPSRPSHPHPRPGRDRHHQGQAVWAAGPVPAPKVLVKKGDPNVKDAVCKAKNILSKDIEVDPATKGVKDAFAYLVKPVG